MDGPQQHNTQQQPSSRLAMLAGITTPAAARAYYDDCLAELRALNTIRSQQPTASTRVSRRRRARANRISTTAMAAAPPPPSRTQQQRLEQFIWPPQQPSSTDHPARPPLSYQSAMRPSSSAVVPPPRSRHPRTGATAAVSKAPSRPQGQRSRNRSLGSLLTAEQAKVESLRREREPAGQAKHTRITSRPFASLTKKQSSTRVRLRP